jgi:hypothetical protein
MADKVHGRESFQHPVKALDVPVVAAVFKVHQHGDAERSSHFSDSFDVRRITIDAKFLLANAGGSAAQLPLESQFQLYAFNTRAWALQASTDGKWLKTDDPNALSEALQALHKIVPKDGTSIENAFVAMNALNPKPDNVIMITDGLPTQGASAPLIRKTIDGDDRLKLFERAFTKYPRDVPFNIILMPMEGDPMAPSAFWVAARATGGSFLSPSKDWP